MTDVQIDEREAAVGRDGPGVEAAPALDQSAVRVRGLAKVFKRADGSPVAALDEVDVDVRQGEFLVLLGPSGCGKTTLLRSVAGLEQPHAGSIEIGSRTVFAPDRGIMLPAERRRVSMIFQSYALWPHMTAFENVAYPLRVRRTSKAEVVARVERALTLVGIPELAAQYPGQMSGGQQQRVALARAVVTGDSTILFDEPLSNVDAKVRAHLRVELLSMQQELGFSALYVTHDQTEAMELGGRIAVMKRGRIVQIGTPREVYEEPVSRYVANFIGTSNEIVGVVSEVRQGREVAVVDTALGMVEARPSDPDLRPADETVVVFRPEACEIDLEPRSGVNTWEGTVEAAMFSGSHTEYIVRVGPITVRVWRAERNLLATGTTVWLSVPTGMARAVPDDDGAQGGGVG